MRARGTVFYRYPRFMTFDQGRAELVPVRNGGACLRFQTHHDDPRCLWFTYGVSEENQPFSKTVAKKIADTRAESVELEDTQLYFGKIPFTQSSDELYLRVLEFCFSQPLSPNTPPHIAYAQAGMMDFALWLRGLLLSNSIEQQRLQLHKDSIRAIDTHRRYSVSQEKKCQEET